MGQTLQNRGEWYKVELNIQILRESKEAKFLRKW